MLLNNNHGFTSITAVNSLRPHSFVFGFQRDTSKAPSYSPPLPLTPIRTTLDKRNKQEHHPQISPRYSLCRTPLANETVTMINRTLLACLVALPITAGGYGVFAHTINSLAGETNGISDQQVATSVTPAPRSHTTRTSAPPKPLPDSPYVKPAAAAARQDAIAAHDYVELSQPFDKWSLVCSQIISKGRQACYLQQMLTSGPYKLIWRTVQYPDGKLTLFLKTPRTINKLKGISLIIDDRTQSTDPTSCTNSECTHALSLDKAAAEKLEHSTPAFSYWIGQQQYIFNASWDGYDRAKTARDHTLNTRPIAPTRH